MSIVEINDYKLNLPMSIRNEKLILKKAEIEERNDRQITKRKWFEINNTDNLFLIYHKLFPYPKENKKDFLNAFLNVYKKSDDSLVKNYLARQIAVMKSLEKQGYKCRTIDNLSTDWRFIPGIGTASVLETSISLHPLYGFPYLPGSSVKGIARANAVQNGMDSGNMIKLFGSDEEEDGNDNQKGKVIFFDAIPEGLPELGLDIMNVHYQKYYSDAEAPGDWMEPIPIFFISIKPGQKFYFFIASRDEDLLNCVEKELVNGLQEMGAGSKSNVGYGYFNNHN